MMRRAFLAILALIALSQTATAGVPLFGHVSCAVVRFYVAKYSEATAVNWARGHGASNADIEAARRCLHGAPVQTASTPVRPQAAVPVPATEPTQHEPAERKPDPEVVHVEAVQVQHDDPEGDSHDSKPTLAALNRPADRENGFATRVSYEMKDRAAPSDGKTGTGRRHYARVHHHAGRAAVTANARWLKRLWAQLTSPRRFRVAFLHSRGSRQ
jgi:hypothetical protein